MAGKSLQNGNIGKGEETYFCLLSGPLTPTNGLLSPQPPKFVHCSLGNLLISMGMHHFEGVEGGYDWRMVMIREWVEERKKVRGGSKQGLWGLYRKRSYHLWQSSTPSTPSTCHMLARGRKKFIFIQQGAANQMLFKLGILPLLSLRIRDRGLITARWSISWRSQMPVYGLACRGRGGGRTPAFPNAE